MNNGNLFYPAFLLLIASFLFLFLGSCKKPNKEFVGTYIGSSKLNGGIYPQNDTIVISADSANNSDIIIVDKLLVFRIYGSVNGNDISIYSQQVEDYGNATTDTYTGSGGLSGSTLTLTFYGTGTDEIAFTGSK